LGGLFEPLNWQKIINERSEMSDVKAIKILERLQNNDVLINRGDIIQDIQDILEFLTKRKAVK